MKTTLNRKELLAALETVSPAVATSTTIPEAQAVKLCCDGGGSVSITAQSMMLGAEVAISGTTSAPGTVVVPHAKLVALLQGSSEKVSLEAAAGRLNISMGRTKAAISTYDPLAFIATPDIQCSALLTIGGKELADVLHTSVMAAGDGTNQSWHEGVCFRSGPDGVMVYAADGKQFSCIHIPESSSSDFESVVPNKELKRVIPTIAGCDSVSLMFGDKGVRITCDDAAFTVQALALKYPAVKVVSDRFDSECSNSLTVSRDALLTSLRQASVMQEAIEFNVKISASEDGLRVFAQSSDSGGYDDVLEARTGKCAVAMPDIGINHKMLMAHLQTIKCNTVEIHYAAETVALKITQPEFPHRAYYCSVIRKAESK